jgi:recombination protein RecA
MVLSPARKFRPVIPQSPWSLGEIAGRLVEISSSAASAALSIVFDLVREAQRRGEPVGWVTASKESFYPPDVAQNGLDLNALAVVRLNHAPSIARAGEKLLRSGGFGMIVLDLRDGDIPLPLQTRLTGLAHRHHTALVCLTEKSSAAVSLGSLVSLRAHAERKRAEDRRFACVLRVLKDKRRGPTWNYEDLYNGPPGLC